MEAALMDFSRSSGIFDLMALAWGWPAIESLHFIGLCLLVGTVGLFDLRMLGCFRQIPLRALYRLLPLGVAGFLLNIVTGFMFLATDPGQYLYNPAMQLKMLFIIIAGFNMLIFHGFYAGEARLAAEGPESAPGWQLVLIALVSLTCWLAVITAGRLITFFRPPDFWCFWCGW